MKFQLLHRQRQDMLSPLLLPAVMVIGFQLHCFAIDLIFAPLTDDIQRTMINHHPEVVPEFSLGTVIDETFAPVEKSQHDRLNQLVDFGDVELVVPPTYHDQRTIDLIEFVP